MYLVILGMEQAVAGVETVWTGESITAETEETPRITHPPEDTAANTWLPAAG